MADTAKDQEYEILTPPTDLRSKVRELTPREAKKFDPVKAAEAALERLAPHFGNWMDNETRDLLSAWESIKIDGLNEGTMATLYQAAHNIKGQALTLGFPLVGDVAAGFCHLIETIPSPDKLPPELAERYVEAIRAMVTEGAKDDANKTGVALLETLSSVTDAYLAQFPKKDGAKD
ncbi:Hpt domain-containing protein [Roseibium sediminicola]|uniref:Hpt domain-containing protein n=1 Tax=Roseibium sediminicola TaxID=2933272 RepID=A0ABT0GZN7_9HYPH|nr:Hpt domain-containing protein [Roseibium sp. CAU 1639]MCK7614532.1 Hpt domain-containing protein [Roseibium sp. CAU 1639]